MKNGPQDAAVFIVCACVMVLSVCLNEGRALTICAWLG